MGKDLLLVIDMQNVYGANGAWCCPNAEDAGKRIKDLIRKKRGAIDVIFTRFLSDEKAEGTWRAYNAEYAAINSDAYANGMMDIFKEELKEYPLYTKSVYSSLAIPEVREAASKAERVVIAGVVAECCVLSTAMAVIDSGSYLIYLRDAAAGLNRDMEKAVETVLSGLEPLQLSLMTCGEYLSQS